MTTLSASERTEPDTDVDRSDVGLIDWVLGDPQLAVTCSAAVDPLEIAARLETHGLSSRVAVDSFGYPDVFTAANVVYAYLPFEDVEAPARSAEPMGGPLDLLRGALYALPALFFPVVVNGFSVHPQWWVLPVGLTVAWAISQAVAAIAWALRGRGDERSDSLLALGSVLVNAAVCLGCAVLAWRELGGNEASVVVAVGVAVYIGAAGMLLFQRAEWMLAICMLPAAVGSLSAVGLLPITISHRAAAWTVVATTALVVAIANRHLLSRHWRRPALHRADRERAAQYFLYGLGCGLLTSVFIGFADEINGSGGALVIAVWPLLLTLGLMEWQLRSFRSRATAAMATSPDLTCFGHRIRAAFRRSMGTYVAALAGLSVVGVVIGSARHASMVPLLLAAVGALGVSFFLALLLGTTGRISLVLACWGATFAILGATLAATEVVRGHITPSAGFTALLVSTGASIVIMAALSRRVLMSPLSY
ncbi:MAG TPA: hypothetical protein VII19_03055 [Acidimicrobiales bacterium]